MIKAKLTLTNTLRMLRRRRVVKGTFNHARKDWPDGPKQNVLNRKASGYTGVKLFAPF